MLIGGSASTLAVIAELQDLQSIADHHAGNTEQKVLFLGRIRGHFGYGGFIHQFKNYVLRQDNRLIEKIEGSLSSLNLNIQDYKNLDINPEEHDALASLQSTIFEYMEKLPIAVQSAAIGRGPQETDALVEVDDTGALEAIAVLERIVQDNRQYYIEYEQQALETGQAKIRWVLFLLPVFAVAAFAILILLRKLTVESESSRIRLDSILNNVFFGVITIDERGIVQSFNRTAENLFGYSAHEVIGSNVSLLMPEPYKSQHDSHIQQFQKGAESKVMGIGRELFGRRKDGGIFPIEVEIEGIKVSGKRNFIGIVHNIERRKETEATLSKTMSNLKAAQRIAGLGSWDWDILTGERWWSDELYRLFGREAQEDVVSFDVYLETIHPEDREKVLEAASNGIVDNAPYIIEYRIVRPDGTEKTVREIGESVLNDEGPPVRMTGTIHDITKAKQDEQTLRNSEQRFREFAESSSDWFWEMGPDLRFKYMSEKHNNMSGLSPEEVIAKTREELGGGDPDDQNWKHHLADLKAHRPFRDFRYSKHTDDGRVFHYSTSGAPVFDKRGNFEGYRGTGSNLTAEVEAEQMARDAQRKLYEAIEAIPEGFVVFDANDRMVLCNSRYREFYIGHADLFKIGEKFEDILRVGVTRGDFAIPADHEEEWIRNRVAQHNNPGEDFLQELGDGRILMISERRTQNGGIVGLRTDVTERVLLEEHIRLSEERYTLVVDGVQDAIWDWNIDDNSLYTSPRMFHFLGYEEGSLTFTPQSWLRRIHPQDREKYQTRLKKYLNGTDENYTCEYRVRNNKDNYIWVLDRGVALRRDDGLAYRMSGSVSDITQRRLAEDALRHSQKIDAIGQLAGGIAHEFNNVISGIGGFAELALMDIEDPDGVRSALEEISKATSRASKLTGDLLAFSRNQEVNPTLIDFDVSDIVEEMETFLRPVLNKNIILTIEKSDQPAITEGDPGHLSQVVLNLALNARDVMPDGGVLTIGSRVVNLDETQTGDHTGVQPGAYAQIYVKDTGTGMDSETMKRIFEPFFTTKEVGKGTGLGLSVAYGIVEKVGGFIHVESMLGKGTTFNINLRLVKQSP